MNNPHVDRETDVVDKTQVEHPKLYRVVVHNDDKTPFVFVVILLISIFDKDEDSAYDITDEVHNNGRGIAGIYTYEIAETYVTEALAVSRQNGYPLQITIEED